VALIAGNVIACERADRSAEFLAYQGATRAMVAASKMILCAMVYAAVCSVTFVTSLWLPETGVPYPGGYHYCWNYQLRAAATGLGFFGCGWLFSSFLTSPVLAVALPREEGGVTREGTRRAARLAITRALLAVAMACKTANRLLSSSDSGKNPRE
jgi:hypothetical protein